MANPLVREFLKRRRVLLLPAALLCFLSGAAADSSGKVSKDQVHYPMADCDLFAPFPSNSLRIRR
jgi:hypothetical protein